MTEFTGDGDEGTTDGNGFEASFSTDAMYRVVEVASIQIEEYEPSSGGNSPSERLGMASAARCSVNDGVSGTRVEDVQDLLKHDWSMAVGGCHLLGPTIIRHPTSGDRDPRCTL